MEYPASGSAVSAERAQNVIGTFEQQIAQPLIVGFGDSNRVMVAKPVAALSQSQIAGYITTL